MPTHLSFEANPLLEAAGLGRAFEDAVRETMRAGGVETGVGPLQVRFSVWNGDTVRYVCKVEDTVLSGPSLSTPAWRWWSGFFETAEELADQLGDALAARRAAPSTRSAPRERWGWAELQTL